jgi:hypothetical protein
MERAFDAIIRVLSPYLGDNMARAAVQSQREKLGLADQPLGAKDLEGFLDRLGPGLVVFVGREKTQRILDQVRVAVAPMTKGGGR